MARRSENPKASRAFLISEGPDGISNLSVGKAWWNFSAPFSTGLSLDAEAVYLRAKGPGKGSQGRLLRRSAAREDHEVLCFAGVKRPNVSGLRLRKIGVRAGATKRSGVSTIKMALRKAAGSSARAESPLKSAMQGLGTFNREPE